MPAPVLSPVRVRRSQVLTARAQETLEVVALVGTDFEVVGGGALVGVEEAAAPVRDDAFPPLQLLQADSGATDSGLCLRSVGVPVAIAAQLVCVSPVLATVPASPLTAPPR